MLRCLPDKAEHGGICNDRFSRLEIAVEHCPAVKFLGGGGEGKNGEVLVAPCAEVKRLCNVFGRAPCIVAAAHAGFGIEQTRRAETAGPLHKTYAVFHVFEEVIVKGIVQVVSVGIKDLVVKQLLYRISHREGILRPPFCSLLIDRSDKSRTDDICIGIVLSYRSCTDVKKLAVLLRRAVEELSVRLVPYLPYELAALHVSCVNGDLAAEVLPVFLFRADVIADLGVVFVLFFICPLGRGADYVQQSLTVTVCGFKQSVEESEIHFGIHCRLEIAPVNSVLADAVEAHVFDGLYHRLFLSVDRRLTEDGISSGKHAGKAGLAAENELRICGLVSRNNTYLELQLGILAHDLQSQSVDPVHFRDKRVNDLCALQLMVFNDVVSKLVAFDRYCRDLSGQLFAGEGDVISDLGVRLEQIYIVQYSECKPFAVFLQACVFVMVFHGILFASVGCLCRFGVGCANAAAAVIGRPGRISSDRASHGNSRKKQQGGSRRNYFVFHSLIILFSEREPLPPRTKSGSPLFGQVY